MIGLRTSTHAFDIPGDREYHRWSWRNGQWDGGFGRQVMVRHGSIIMEAMAGKVVAASSSKGPSDHPILQGIKNGDVWDPSDVYTVRLPLPKGCTPLLNGRVLSGMDPD